MLATRDECVHVRNVREESQGSKGRYHRKGDIEMGELGGWEKDI